MAEICTCPRCWGTGIEPPGNVAPCLLCEGSGKVEDGQLSEHFRYSELVHSHHGFANDPRVEYVERLRNLCRELLEPVRAKVGALRVTSGYRSQALDVVADRGNTYWLSHISAHAAGWAADVQPMAAGVTLRDVMEAAGAFALDQRILEGGCVHLAIYSPLPMPSGGQRRQALVRLANPAHVYDHSSAPYVYARWDPNDASQLTRCV